MMLRNLMKSLLVAVPAAAICWVATLSHPQTAHALPAPTAEAAVAACGNSPARVTWDGCYDWNSVLGHSDSVEVYLCPSGDTCSEANGCSGSAVYYETVTAAEIPFRDCDGDCDGSFLLPNCTVGFVGQIMTRDTTTGLYACGGVDLQNPGCCG